MFKTELKKIRLSLYMSQKRFCEVSGIHLGTYKNWELGKHLPTPESWGILLEFLREKRVRVAALTEAYNTEKVGENK